MNLRIVVRSLTLLAITIIITNGSSTAQAQAASAKKPNILVIMGDDVGWFKIGAYHRGIMSGKTPNLENKATKRANSERIIWVT